MPVSFRNFSFSYLSAKKKPVFVPSDDGREAGLKVKELVERFYDFDPCYWHLRKGGHVGSLHEHRDQEWFAKVDLKNFFYTVRRRQVQTALRECGIRRHEHFAKWSTVKNPMDGGGYVLPYGFVQSPILASLVLAKTQIGEYLRMLPATVTVGVYLDDISLSSNDRAALETAFAGIVDRVEPSGFLLNEGKVVAPTATLEIFNCELKTGFSDVLQSRRDEFYSEPRSGFSVAGFEDYCTSVRQGNV